MTLPEIEKILEYMEKGSTVQEFLLCTADIIDYAVDNMDVTAADCGLDSLSDFTRLYTPSDTDEVFVHFLRGLAKSVHVKANEMGNQWITNQPHTQEQLLEYRRAVCHSGFTKLPIITQTMILNNLSNVFLNVGRSIEAFSTIEKSAIINNNISTIHYNKAIFLTQFTYFIPDDEIICSLLYTLADETFCLAIKDNVQNELTDEQIKTIIEYRKYIESKVEIGLKHKKNLLDNFKISEDIEEYNYRIWVTENKLFLNPLNVFGVDYKIYPVVTTDMLKLPKSLEYNLKNHEIINFYNQIKQEFICARFLFFENMKKLSNLNSSHFVDRSNFSNIQFESTLNGYHYEMIRQSFRMAYSIFGKIAFFLNKYYSVRPVQSSVNFRNIWISHLQKNKKAHKEPKIPEIAEVFTKSRNHPLRGLFWLSKDVFDLEIQETTNPNAMKIQEIRNFLEHRHLHITENETECTTKNFDNLNKEVKISMPYHDFQELGIQLLKLVREAIIYLTLTVYWEESELGLEYRNILNKIYL